MAARIASKSRSKIATPALDSSPQRGISALNFLLTSAPRTPPPMYITLYFLVTRLPDSLRVVRDHFLAVYPTTLTVDSLEKALLAAEKSIVAVGASRGDPRAPIFEGCSPSPLLPSVASAAAADLVGLESVGAASAPSGRRRSGKGKGGKGAGGAMAAVAAGVAAAVAVVAEVAEVAAVEVEAGAVEAEAGVAEVEVVGVELRSGAALVAVSASSSSSSSSVLATSPPLTSCLGLV
ncbi:unnamed protein product [Closterium sp. NIES-64]|nr:unnamed protein product [Closterium sp. NIES-64]